jgi:hypothetical protein
MKLGTERIGNARIDIEVDTNGSFSADFNDQHFSSRTRLELVEQLKRVVKKAEQQGTVDVTVLGLVPNKGRRSGFGDDPFDQGDGAVHAKLRTKHEREHGTYLMVSDDSAKQKFKVGNYSRRDVVVCRRLTEVEVVTYKQLCEARRLAVTALEDFVGDHKIDMDEALAGARKKEA